MSVVFEALRRVGAALIAGSVLVVAVSVLNGSPNRPTRETRRHPAARPAGAVVGLDAFRADAQSVAGLRAQGLRPTCRLDAGGWEPARPDAARFAPSVIGRPTGEPDGSRWLDARRWDLLAPILASRLDLCRSKGFDTVVVDHVDGYAHRSGFAIGLTDQRRFNAALAALAHARGLRIGCLHASAATGALDFSATGPAWASGVSGAAAGSAGTSTTTGS